MTKMRNFTVIVKQTRCIQRGVVIEESEVNDLLKNRSIHLDDIITQVNTSPDVDQKYDYKIIDNDTGEILVDFE